MTHAINPGPVPPERGLEKEEPELWQEDDIPRDDSSRPDAAGEGKEPRERDVDRE